MGVGVRVKVGVAHWLPLGEVVTESVLPLRAPAEGEREVERVGEGVEEPLPPPPPPTLPPVAVAAPVLLWVDVGLLEKLPVEVRLGLSVPLPLKEALREGVGDTVVLPTAAPCRLGERLPLPLCVGLREAVMVPVPLPAAPCRVEDTEGEALPLPPPSRLSVAV